jgi:hypothetical protein
MIETVIHLTPVSAAARSILAGVIGNHAGRVRSIERLAQGALKQALGHKSLR